MKLLNKRGIAGPYPEYRDGGTDKATVLMKLLRKGNVRIGRALISFGGGIFAPFLGLSVCLKEAKWKVYKDPRCTRDFKSKDILKSRNVREVLRELKSPKYIQRTF